MKNLIKLSVLFLLFSLPSLLQAQNNDRFKITMTINHGGKNIASQITTVSYGVSRYNYPAAPTATDATTKADSKDKNAAVPERGSYYLSLMVKEVSNDLLKLFSKKDTKFSGTITVVDTYGKNAQKEIKFTSASLESYSDQFNSASYDDGYATASMSFTCNAITINGITME